MFLYFSVVKKTVFHKKISGCVKTGGKYSAPTAGKTVGDMVGAFLVVTQNTDSVLDAHMELNNTGQMIETEWLKLP